MLTLVHEITTNVTTVQTNRSIQTLTQIGDLMEQMSSNSLIAVVDSSGLLNTDDAIVDLPIIGNIKRQTAKLTDLDVECQDRSTIYGMNFGIGLSDDFPTSESDTALYGNWTPNVIAQRMWHRLKCYSATNNNSQLYQDSFPFGAQSTTTLTELLWNPDILNSSIVLNELHGLSSDILSVRITINLYTQNYPPFVALNATLGYVYGVIGAVHQVLMTHSIFLEADPCPLLGIFPTTMYSHACLIHQNNIAIPASLHLYISTMDGLPLVPPIHYTVT